MKRCIFCGKSENEFDSKNQWSIEHIIPEALGNPRLEIGLRMQTMQQRFGQICGQSVVNSALFKLIRQRLGSEAGMGLSPMLSARGEDQYGNKVRMDWI